MKIAVAATLMATAVLAAVSVYLFRELSAERAHARLEGERLEASEADRARLRNELQALRTERGTAEDSSANRTSPSTDATSQTAHEADVEHAEPPTTTLRRAMNGMMKDPGMQDVIRSEQRRGIQRAYGDLIKDLKLSPEQADRFTQLLLDHQSKVAQRAWTDGGNPEALGAAKNDVKAETDTALLDLLGNERFQKYEDYKNSLPARMQISTLSQQLSSTSAPLSEDQQKGLLTAMLEEKASLPEPVDQNGVAFASSSPEQLQWQSDYDKRVHDRAARILGPEQLKQLEQVQSAQLAMKRMLGRALPGSTPTAATRRQ